VRKLGRRERCGSDAHVAGEEVVRRKAACVGKRGEMSDELGQVTARGRAVASVESSRPATR
jgi:hypothetical protein